MLADEYTPNFSASNAAKDAYLILDAAAANGVRMDATKAAAARLSRAIELGRGDDDFAVSYVAGFE
jgi:3-hydroxyisobutyrate dehydrogenase